MQKLVLAQALSSFERLAPSRPLDYLERSERVIVESAIVAERGIWLACRGVRMSSAAEDHGLAGAVSAPQRGCARAWICASLLAIAVSACSEKETPEQPVPPVDVQPTSELTEPEGPRTRLIDSAIRSDSEWLPEVDLPPAQQVESIALSLERGAELLAAGDLIEPLDESALAYYLSVLELDPVNEQASEGIDAVVMALVVRAGIALEEGDAAQALSVLPVVLRLRPEDPGVQDLRARLDRIRERDDLLTAAQQAIQAGQLTRPADDSAVLYFRAVLEIDPDNDEARQGLSSVANMLIEQAMAAARDMNFSTADRLLNQAAGVRPGTRSLLDARSRLVEFRERRMAQTLSEIDQALAAGELDRVEQLLKVAEERFPDFDGLQRREEQLLFARVYASRRPGDVFTDRFIDDRDSGPNLVVIPRDEFQMGSPESETERASNEGPLRRIRFRHAFALGQKEVSVAEFRQFVDASGYLSEAEREDSSSIYDERTGRIVRRSGITWRDDFGGDPAADTLPALHLSWNDSQAYLSWLSQRTGQDYRLPSEAEFEFALRAESSSRYWWGNAAPDRMLANVTGDGDRSRSRRSWTNAFKNYSDGYWGPAPVGSFPVNLYGLFDMDGNVSEWVEDCWHDSYRRGPTDGRAWVNPGCDRRVVRGGSWGSSPDQIRSAFRLNAPPDTRGSRVGFRVARDL